MTNKKKGNPLLRIRLPEDHWVWKIENPIERNNEIKKALEFYRILGTKITFIENISIDIKKDLEAILTGTSLETEIKLQDEHNIYLDHMDSLLKF